ncbi:hypothetical protein [Chamaesiphon sp. OTE_20_metabat_361]|uniref:hypothetical protein n=1 Tax=Chamaesiphon sp. OTE_20_metabat_361 TaxID=2964689 RepID=UPI00286A316D|nr:hypothetical protein [Chamaesiphon sp. OTE_20_metabat_361]
MNRLRIDRKPVYSLQRIEVVKKLIAQHWDEIWEIVQQRAQTGYRSKQYSSRTLVCEGKKNNCE